MPRIAHFDISASDTDRASKFYSKVFGWKFEKWDGPMDYWMITTGDDSEPGINGGMMKEDAPKTENTITVPSVDEFSEKIVANGGKEVMPKMSIPGVGYMANFEDTEGNKFGIIEMDEKAA